MNSQKNYEGDLWGKMDEWRTQSPDEKHKNVRYQWLKHYNWACKAEAETSWKIEKEGNETWAFVFFLTTSYFFLDSNESENVLECTDEANANFLNSWYRKKSSLFSTEQTSTRIVPNLTQKVYCKSANQRKSKNYFSACFFLFSCRF